MNINVNFNSSNPMTMMGSRRASRAGRMDGLTETRNRMRQNEERIRQNEDRRIARLEEQATGRNARANAAAAIQDIEGGREDRISELIGIRDSIHRATPGSQEYMDLHEKLYILERRHGELYREEDVRKSELKTQMAQSTSVGLRVALANEISQILQDRADRGAELAEFEAMVNQMIIDNATRAEERDRVEDNSNETEEEREERHEREGLMNLTEIAVHQDNLHANRSLRHQMASEAWHLRRAIGAESSNIVMENSRDDMFVSTLKPGGFVETQHTKLHSGMGALDASMLNTIADMYQTSTQNQEEYLARNNSEEYTEEEAYDEEM